MFSKVTRIVPILSQDSSHIFTAPFLVNPWIDPATKALTSAIQPGVKFDMLGACTTQEMYENGTADATDSISVFNARVDNLFYQTKNGKAHKLYVGDRDSFMFRVATVDNAKDVNPSRLVLETNVVLDAGGIPTTLLGKAWRRLHDFIGHRQLVTVHVTGYVDVDMAAVQVQAIEPDHSDVKVVGYTLDMARTNLNRVPRETANV